MLRYYFQQALFQLRAQPLLGVITIAGNALSLFLIMVVVMMQQVNTAPFPPESNRDRMLHVQWMYLVDKQSGEQTSGMDFLSERMAKECFLNLETPEAVTLYSVPEVMAVSLPKQAAEWVDVRGTDAAFWHVFDFTFIDGSPYDQAESDAGQWKAVITEKIARDLFGEVKVSGREILLNGRSSRIAGVVREVSTLASASYAQIWLPYRAMGLQYETHAKGMTGLLMATILARDVSDFPLIREESERLRKKMNESLGTDELNYMHQPDEQEKATIRRLNQSEPDMGAVHRRQWMVYLVLLVVPAINLASMTQGRYRRRMQEIGIRRAFGATRGDIIRQVWMENLIVTGLGGILGLFLCVLFSIFGSDFLFGSSMLITPLRQPVSVDWQLFFRVSVFAYTLFFCLILNMLSSSFPAWKASRNHLVNALGGH